MRRYRLELVRESGADEPEETVLRTSTDAARLLMPLFEGADPAPSAEDIELTKRLREAGEVVGIRVLDHVILGDGKHYSFVDAGSW